jgi:hypothetical protein
LTVESALKIEISRYMKSVTERVTDKEDLLREIELLRTAVVDGIITTNWDRFLETLFPEFRVYIGQNELLFSTPQSIGEIYKIHGCCSQPNSLVLTADDYRTFDERNPYLASKLLTVFVEHPVLFLGYSLNDANTMTILRSIAACLTSENINQLRNRLIFVQWAPGVEDYEMQSSSIVAEGFNIPVIHIRTDSFAPIYEALSELQRRFPAQLLRRLKEHVYKLVLTNDPNCNLYVQDIEEANDSSEMDVVIGVGVTSELGYRAVMRDDLLSNILFDTGRYDPKGIVNDVLPVQLRRTQYVPIFKYLRAASMIDKSGALLTTDLDSKVEEAAQPSVEKFLPPPSGRDRWRRRIEGRDLSLTDVIEGYDEQHALHLIPFLSWDELPLAGLLKFLVSCADYIESPSSSERSQFCKLVCLYDYLRYRRSE